MLTADDILTRHGVAEGKEGRAEVLGYLWYVVQTGADTPLDACRPEGGQDAGAGWTDAFRGYLEAFYRPDPARDGGGPRFLYPNERCLALADELRALHRFDLRERHDVPWLLNEFEPQLDERTYGLDVEAMLGLDPEVLDFLKREDAPFRVERRPGRFHEARGFGDQAGQLHDLFLVFDDAGRAARLRDLLGRREEVRKGVLCVGRLWVSEVDDRAHGIDAVVYAARRLRERMEWTREGSHLSYAVAVAAPSEGLLEALAAHGLEPLRVPPDYFAMPEHERRTLVTWLRQGDPAVTDDGAAGRPPMGDAR